MGFARKKWEICVSIFKPILYYQRLIIYVVYRYSLLYFDNISIYFGEFWSDFSLLKGHFVALIGRNIFVRGNSSGGRAASPPGVGGGKIWLKRRYRYSMTYNILCLAINKALKGKGTHKYSTDYVYNRYWSIKQCCKGSKCDNAGCVRNRNTRVH